MNNNRFQSVFLAYFLGILFGNILSQTVLLFALGLLGVLYLEQGSDHLFTGALAGFLYSGSVIFAFLISFVVAHAYHAGKTVPLGPGLYFVAALVVMATANAAGFVVALITSEKESLLVSAFLLSAILSLPIPWILRRD